MDELEQLKVQRKVLTMMKSTAIAGGVLAIFTDISVSKDIIVNTLMKTENISSDRLRLYIFPLLFAAFADYFYDMYKKIDNEHIADIELKNIDKMGNL